MLAKVQRVAALFALCLSSAKGAFAGDPKLADKWFKEAFSLSGQQNYLLAAEKYEASIKEEPSIGAYNNLGECYFHLGRFASAHQALMTAADLAHGRGDAREESLRKRLTEILPKVPRYRLAVADPALQVTGVRTGTGSLPENAWRNVFTLPPGEQELVALTTRGEWRKKLVIAEMATDVATITVELAPVAPMNAPIPPKDLNRVRAQASGDSALPVVGWTLVGVGGAAVVTSFVLGGIVLARQEAGRPSSDGDYAVANIATVVGISGGVLAATGLGLLLFGKPKAANVGLYVTPVASGFSGAF